MTITLTREEAQQVLEHLDDLADFQQWDIDMHVTQYGEKYKPHRIKHMKQQLASTRSTIETLRARLAKQTPYEVGQRLYRQGLGISDIPTAVYSDSDIAEAYRGFEDARLSAPEPEPSAWAVQEGDNLHDVFLFKDEADEMCHLKGDHAKAIPLYTSRLSAPEPEPVAGYRWEEGRTPPSVTFTASPQREWQGLTAYEIQELHLDNTDWGNFACAIEAKLREKNSEP